MRSRITLMAFTAIALLSIGISTADAQDLNGEPTVAETQQDGYARSLEARMQRLEQMMGALAAGIPQGTPMPAFFAKKYLRGDDYSAWALMENDREYAAAQEKYRPGREFSLREYSRRYYGGGSSSINLGLGTINAGGPGYESGRETAYTYEVGGQSGGPVTIYNPYVTPK